MVATGKRLLLSIYVTNKIVNWQSIHLFTYLQAMDNMKKYGKILMSEEPSQTTDLIKLLCTDYKPSDSEF